MELPEQSSPKSYALRSELQLCGVSLIDCPHNGGKDVADKMMIGATTLLDESTSYSQRRSRHDGLRHRHPSSRDDHPHLRRQGLRLRRLRAMPPPIPPRRPRATRCARKPESPGQRRVPLAGGRHARGGVSRRREAQKRDYPRLLPHAQRPPAADCGAPRPPRPGVSPSVARSTSTPHSDERAFGLCASAAYGTALDSERFLAASRERSRVTGHVRHGTLLLPGPLPELLIIDSLLGSLQVTRRRSILKQRAGSSSRPRTGSRTTSTTTHINSPAQARRRNGPRGLPSRVPTPRS